MQDAPRVTHAMVDIETLSTHHDAAVIAIGLVAFDDSGFLRAQTEILLDPALVPGHRDDSTVAWWRQQDPRVFARMMSGRTEPLAACEEMTTFIKAVRPKTLWANPPTFDVVILRSLFSAVGAKFPMHFREARDCRTLYALARQYGIDYRAAYADVTAHDALSDAIAQAKAVQIILSQLKERVGA